MFAENCPYGPNYAGHIVMPEYQQSAIKIGFQPPVIERNEPRHVLPKNRGRCLVLSVVAAQEHARAILSVVHQRGQAHLVDLAAELPDENLTALTVW